MYFLCLSLHFSIADKGSNFYILSKSSVEHRLPAGTCKDITFQLSLISRLYNCSDYAKETSTQQITRYDKHWYDSVSLLIRENELNPVWWVHRLIFKTGNLKSSLRQKDWKWNHESRKDDCVLQYAMFLIPLQSWTSPSRYIIFKQIVSYRNIEASSVNSWNSCLTTNYCLFLHCSFVSYIWFPNLLLCSWPTYFCPLLDRWGWSPLRKRE